MSYFEKFKNILFADSGNKKLIILDDIFPWLLSSFRIAEYNYYLKIFDDVEIFSSVSDFEKYKSEYVEVYPQFADHIKRFDSLGDYNCSLFYTIFINNAFKFLPIIEKQKTSFVFELYPGGGFQIDSQESDSKLRAVCSSKYLQKVIVTQINSRNYLIKNNFCNKDKIEFIYGGVLPSDYYRKHVVPKKHYKKEKNTFDICFVANKYMEKGLDKGFDIFIEVAKILCKKTEDIIFHVVSACGEDEINVDDIKGRIKFHGLQYRDFFPEFYSRMDIILSPNRPYVLLPGSFDGFPTGSCAEAGLAGVAVFCSDELSLNVRFKDGEDIRIIPLDADAIADIVMKYYENIEDLYNLASKCQKSFQKAFDINLQMGRRYDMLKKYL